MIQYVCKDVAPLGALNVVKTSDTLLKDYSDNWLETYKASASINTKAMYINAINCHIKPEIGHLSLNKIVRSDMQKLINNRQEHPRTCEIIRLTLVQIFNRFLSNTTVLLTIKVFFFRSMSTLVRARHSPRHSPK